MVKITKVLFIQKEQKGYRAPAKTRVYVHPQGETLLQNLEFRRNRPVALYRRFAEAAAREAGLEGRLRWSQKAGCSCGCSPAFIVEGSRLYPYEIFVDIAGTPEAFLGTAQTL